MAISTNSDYQSLLSKYTQELTSLHSKIAVSESQIQSLCDTLGLVNDDTLAAQISTLETSLLAEQSRLIDSLNSQLDELDLLSDESES